LGVALIPLTGAAGLCFITFYSDFTRQCKGYGNRWWGQFPSR